MLLLGAQLHHEIQFEKNSGDMYIFLYHKTKKNIFKGVWCTSNILQKMTKRVSSYVITNS